MRGINFYLLLVIIFGFTTVAYSQTSTAAASLKILIPLSIVNDTDLNFGNMLSSNLAGTVKLTPAGGRTRTGGTTFLPSLPGTVSAAQFTVTGQPNASFTITVPANNTVKLSKSGALDMKVQTFKHSLTSASSRKLSSSGIKTFTVGATLNININQAAGFYLGTFNVTVAYN